MIRVFVFALCLFAVPAFAADWPHQGPLGTYDRPALQRGLQVHRNVCTACHSMDLVRFRHLTPLGYSHDEIRALAADDHVKPGDAFPAPYPDDETARSANGGALPPDLSLIVKARSGHEDMIYGILTGYADPPDGVEMTPGMSYNTAFHGGQIAMPEPLTDGIVTCDDGTEASVSQMSRDVVQFLVFAGDMHMEARKRTGIGVMLFMLIFSAMMYGVKRKIWTDVHK
ncbi:MAG: cytochrome c1 [Pseudomonadota bacterium]|nr:cytochrome c1 [Pseudomonadota bacterium]